jgi:hypothetical protein
MEMERLGEMREYMKRKKNRLELEKLMKYKYKIRKEI